MKNAKKKNHYNRLPINGNPPLDERPKSIKRLEDEAASRARADRRRRIDELADEQAERMENREVWDV